MNNKKANLRQEEDDKNKRENDINLLSWESGLSDCLLQLGTRAGCN